jgi:pilus assembly protein FimV
MGDYSQAAELLQGALNHQSERDDLAYKLLEARHAEGNEAGYLEAVENHRTLLENGPLWEQVLAMGSELAPEHPLFVVAEEGDEGGLFGVLEPPQEAPLEDTAMMPVPPMPPPPPQSVSTTSDASADVLEFVAPEKDEQAIEAQSPTEVELDLDGGLEFDLGTFSLDEETEQSQSGSESGVGEALEEEFGKLGDEDVDHLDLQDEALKLGGNPAAVAPEDASESEPSVNAEVLEFPAPPEATDAGGVSAPSDGEDSDESSFVDTKLDLATAYLEMGDNSGARTLYQEVIEEGNAAQRQEAQDGLDRIGFG